MALDWRALVTRDQPAGSERILLNLLRPLGILYGWAAGLRTRLYRLRVLSAACFPVPVISVGNLACGGTGKTPMVSYLVDYFLQQGFRVAVVSRGYGGHYSQSWARVPSTPSSRGDAMRFGDEPVLLARRHPEALVIVARQRRLGVAAAIGEGRADLVLLDDGYQHLAVQRDVNLLLLDARQEHEQQRVLPAGLYRESPLAVDRADAVIYTHATADRDVPPPKTGVPVVRCRHRLAAECLALDGTRIPLQSVVGRKVVAFSGIADPAGFFEALRQEGVELQAGIDLPDHVEYDGRVLQRLRDAAASAEILLTTEKDAVKLATDDLPCACYLVPLELEFIDPLKPVFDLIEDVIDRRRKGMSVSEELLQILACPQCKGPVELCPEKDAILCPACALKYPVRDDIPVMLIDEAAPLSGALPEGE